MKKIILLGGVLLCAGLAMAQTATEMPSSNTTTPEAVVQINTESTMESIEKNIDRRLMYFNRYKKSDDMESLAKLVSNENKDFYINFIKYVKESPLFTLKRDASTKIVKTPTEEYVLSVTMTLEGVDKKVSMTFFEEKSETGSKWLIIDSNLHIQNADTKLGNTLASSTLEKNTTATPKTKVTREIPKDAGTGTVTTLPVVSTPTPETAEKTPDAGTTPAVTNEIAPKELSNIVLIVIALGTILGIGGGVFGFIKWKHKHAAVAAAATTVVASVAPIVTPAINTPDVTPVLPVIPPAESNVTVSTVEKIALGSEAPDMNTPEATPVQTETVAPASDSFENTTPSTPSVAAIAPESSPTTEVEVVSETPPAPVEETIPTAPESTISEPETTTENPSIESPEETITPQLEAEKPVADIFSQGEGVAQNTQEVTSSLDQAMNNSPLFANTTASSTDDNQPHALFDSIFTPAEASKPEAEVLFTDMLKSGS